MILYFSKIDFSSYETPSFEEKVILTKDMILTVEITHKYTLIFTPTNFPEQFILLYCNVKKTY